MVKVLRWFVRGPLELHVSGFAEELRRQGYSRSGVEQHVCFIAHLDRWLSAADIGLGELSGPVIERYLDERRAAGYVNYRSAKAMWPLLDYLAPLGCCRRRHRWFSIRRRSCWSSFVGSSSSSADWQPRRLHATWLRCGSSWTAGATGTGWILLG